MLRESVVPQSEVIRATISGDSPCCGVPHRTGYIEPLVDQRVQPGQVGAGRIPRHERCQRVGHLREVIGPRHRRRPARQLNSLDLHRLRARSSGSSRHRRSGSLRSSCRLVGGGIDLRSSAHLHPLVPAHLLAIKPHRVLRRSEGRVACQRITDLTGTQPEVIRAI